ncbi:CD151 antigen-like [Chrysoperla carnea]|uniref:CD151 antigen-like n=1 Tax=Chrysoperla carnea TaxID=189513 RepID=UPI001D07E137|nr:CD151 antigen-like [Chrysoperla carnea]
MAPRKTRDSGCCSVNFLKYVLHLYNMVFVITGAIVLGIGIWTILEKHQYISLLSSGTYAAAAYIFVAAGSLVLIVALLGCCSVLKENRPLLISYIFLLLFIFLLEAMVGIMSYIYREQLNAELEQTLNTTFLESYAIDPHRTKAIDLMQQEYKCCGAIRFEDWEYSQAFKENKTKYPTPDSCCKTPSLNCGRSISPSNIFYNGCLNRLTSEMRQHLSILSAVGLGICVVQIFGINLACSLHLKLRHILD